MNPGGDARTQTRVGAAMFAVLVFGLVFVAAILPRLDLGGGIRAGIGFFHVGALREGAPIIVAGRTVGHVESIVLIDSNGLPADHVLAGTGGAMVQVRIDEDLVRMVPSNGDYFISSRGILADRYLEVGPPRDGAAPGPPLAAGAQVRGIDPPSIDSALQQTWDNLVVSREFMDAIEPEAAALGAQLTALAATIDAVAPTPGAYGELALRVRALLAEADDLRATLDAAGANPEQLEALAGRARATIERARAAVASIRAAADRLLAEVDRVRASVERRTPELERLRAALVAGQTLLARAEKLAANGQELMAMIERGEGSLLKLSNDPEFPEDAKDVGKLLKRNPWRIIGRPDDATAVPRRPAQ